MSLIRGEQITGSVASASFAVTASYVKNAQTASYVLNAQTASYVLNAVSSSFAISSSRAISSSYASTASYVQLAQTASYVLQAISSSFATTASYYGGSVVSASYAVSSSQTQNATTASYALTASYSLNGGGSIDTGSLVTTASFNSYTGSNTSQFAGTSSYALTASYVANASSFPFTGSAIITGSLVVTGPILMSGSSFISGVDYIDFDTTASNAGAVARLKWNDTDGTLDLGLKGGNVTLQIGQEQVVRVVNKTGTNLLESQYKAIRIRRVDEGGAQGQRLAIVLAQANNDANSVDTLGLVTEDINVNQEGFITNSGLVRGINTTGALQGETWTDGDVLYLSPTTAGSITKVKPQAPQHSVIIGYVVYAHVNNGTIFVKVDNGYEIDELHNVRINTGSLTSGNLLVYSGSVWTNSKNLTGSYALTGSLTFAGGSKITNEYDYPSIDIQAGTGGYVELLSNNQSSSFILTNQNVAIATSGGSWIFGEDGTTSYPANVIAASFTGSLLGSASYALTASYVANASSFPFTGSAIITGSLSVTGSVTATSFTGDGSGLTGLTYTNQATNLFNYYNFI